MYKSMEQELPNKNQEDAAQQQAEEGQQLVKQGDGLIERVDIQREYVTRDGRKLLTERIR